MSTLPNERLLVVHDLLLNHGSEFAVDDLNNVEQLALIRELLSFRRVLENDAGLMDIVTREMRRNGAGAWVPKSHEAELIGFARTLANTYINGNPECMCWVCNSGKNDVCAYCRARAFIKADSRIEARETILDKYAKAEFDLARLKESASATQTDLENTQELLRRECASHAATQLVLSLMRESSKKTQTSIAYFSLISRVEALEHLVKDESKLRVSELRAAALEKSLGAAYDDITEHQGEVAGLRADIVAADNTIGEITKKWQEAIAETAAALRYLDDMIALAEYGLLHLNENNHDLARLKESAAATQKDLDARFQRIVAAKRGTRDSSAGRALVAKFAAIEQERDELKQKLEAAREDRTALLQINLASEHVNELAVTKKLLKEANDYIKTLDELISAIELAKFKVVERFANGDEPKLLWQLIRAIELNIKKVVR